MYGRAGMRGIIETRALQQKEEERCNQEDKTTDCSYREYTVRTVLEKRRGRMDVEGWWMDERWWVVVVGRGKPLYPCTFDADVYTHTPTCTESRAHRQEQAHERQSQATR